MLRKTLTASAIALSACAPAPNAKSPSATAPETPAAPVEPMYLPSSARVVRCGVDDRPRSVIGSREHVRSPLLGMPAQRVLADMAIEPPPEVPRATIDLFRLAPAALPGRTLPDEIAASLAATDPQYGVCAGLMQPDDGGVHAHRVVFATTGQPVTVESDGDPSPFARCLMERSCQLHAASGPVAAVVSIRALRTEPPAPPTPPPAEVAPAPPPDFLVRFEPLSSERNRGRIASIARPCVARTKSARPSTVKIRVTQQPLVAPPSGGGRSMGPRARMEALDVVSGFRTTATVLSVKGGGATALAACLQKGLRGHTAGLGGPFSITLSLE